MKLVAGSAAIISLWALVIPGTAPLDEHRRHHHERRRRQFPLGNGDLRDHANRVRRPL